MNDSDFVESYMYEWDLSQGQHIFQQADLLSLKIRPILEIGEFTNSYVYPDEYGQTYELFSTYEKQWSGRVNRGSAELYVVQGLRTLLVEHETGPEVVF